MSVAAPRLTLIEGGRQSAPPAVAAAPPIPPASEADRLYPAFTPPGGGAFACVLAVSLILHGAALFASFDWAVFDEERAIGGTEEFFVIEGVDVVLLDQAPSPASALAEAVEVVEEVAEAPDPSEIAALQPELADSVVADREPDSEANLATLPAEASPEEVVSPLESEPSIEGAAFATAKPLPGSSPGVAPARPVVETESRRVADAAPTPSAAQPSLVADDQTVKPVEETEAVTAEIVEPLSPADPPTKPAPAKESVAPAANPSVAASEANRQAEGPTKGKAGAGGKAKTEGKASVSSYQARLVAHLRRYRSYPDAARARRLTGTAIVSFTIDKGGRVVGASLANGAGHPVLDEAAVAMVRHASPFPAIPADLGMSRMTVRAPIRFDLR